MFKCHNVSYINGFVLYGIVEFSLNRKPSVMAQKYDIFISYSRTDYYVKEALRKEFEDAQLNVWVDSENIRFGDEWKTEIREAIKESHALVVLVSPDAAVSKWVSNEITAAEILEKDIFVVLVRGDVNDIPFGLLDKHYADLRRGNQEDIPKLVKVLKESVAGQEVDPGLLHQRPRVELEASQQGRGNPIVFTDMLLIENLLESVAELITLSDSDESRGRVALFKFGPRKKELYMIAATSHIQEREYRWRFPEGVGIAGEFWERDRNRGAIIYPKTEYTEEHMLSKWRFTPSQIDATQDIGTLIIYPVSDGRNVIGIISLDSPQELTSQQIRDRRIFNSLEYIQQTIGRAINGTTPLSYRQYFNLQSVVRVARLIPPLPIPIRGGIFWLDRAREELYLLVGSEEFASAWTNDIRFKKGVSIAGRVWETGELEFEDRSDVEDIEEYLAKEHKMNAAQIEVAKETKSILGMPIFDERHEALVGVLIVDSPNPMAESKLQDQRALMNELAKLAARILGED